MMTFSVAVIQQELVPGDADRNRDNVTRQVAEAANAGAGLIVLPEGSLSDIYRGAGALAESIPGATTAMVARVAGNAIVALPLLEKRAEGVCSACAVVNQHGVLGVARKTHLFRDPTGHDTFADSEVIKAGDQLSVIDTGQLKLGILLGFDAEFPETFRTLALRGADLIIVALNTILPDHAFLSAMARRNRIPLAVANRLGFKRVYPAVPEFSAGALSLLREPDGNYLVRCRGGSAIFDEDGRLLAEPNSDQSQLDRMAGVPEPALIPSGHFQREEILKAALPLHELRSQRLSSPFLAARREELYRTLS